MTLTQGYHLSIPLDVYLRDPAPEPSLSKSTILALVNHSPKRAHATHPRFGNRQSDDSSRGDVGSAVHSLALGGNGVVYAPSEFEDWRKKAAQEFRDGARTEGKIPLLDRQRSEITSAAWNSREVIESFGHAKFEVTMIYQYEGVWFRTRPDCLTSEFDIELKTCEDADIDSWVRRCVEQSGYDVQMGMRWLGHKLLGEERKMRWLLQEIENDLETVWADVGEELLTVAMRKINYAAKLWRKCLDTELWPGYQSGSTVLPTASALWNLEARNIP